MLTREGVTFEIVCSYTRIVGNNMKKLFSLVCLLVLVPAIQESTDTIPFQILGGIPVIECTINEKGPFPMALDTGCYDICLRPNMTKKLELEMGEHKVKFAAGKTELKDIPIKIENTPHWSQFTGGLKDVCGIVGYPFLKSFAITFDYKKKTIALKKEQGKDAKAQPISINRNGWIFIKCTINGKGPFECMIDTGCEFNYITSKLAKKAGAKFENVKTTLKSLSIEGNEIQDIDAYRNDVIGFAEPGVPECLIGTPFLSQFITTIDYKNKTIRFIKNDADRKEENKIPFRQVLGAPIVECIINGKGPFEILLDLGSYDVAVRPYMSKKLGMKMGTHKVTFSIGKSVVKDLKFSIADAPQWEQFEINEGLKNVAGVCGYPFLHNFIITIDYKNNTLGLDPHGTKNDSEKPRKGETRVKFDLRECRIFVKASINGKGPYTLLLDSGANFVFLTRKTAKELSLQFDSDETAKLKSVAIDEAKAVDLEAKKIPGGIEAERIYEKEFGKIDGILGHPFLKHFVVTIDYKKKVIKLKAE